MVDRMELAHWIGHLAYRRMDQMTLPHMLRRA